MTQLSFAWDCTPAVGDFSPYTLEIVEATQRIMGNISPQTGGVVYWTDSTVFPSMTNATDELLEPEFVSGNTVRVNTGVGMVQGWLYLNDVDIDTDVSGGNANATDIIGLRRDLTGQTVRLFHGRGGAGLTYSLVQTSTTWETPIAGVTLDGSGNYSSLSDLRKFTTTPLVPPAKYTHTYQPIAGVSNGVQTAVGTFAPDANIVRSGYEMGFVSREDAIFLVDIPEGLYGGEIDLIFHLYGETASGLSGNGIFLVRTMPLQTEVQTATGTIVKPISPPGQAQVELRYSEITSSNLTVVAGQQLLVNLQRNAFDAGDDYNAVIMAMGLTVECNVTLPLETYSNLPPIG